jgi:hypothetical protein
LMKARKSWPPKHGWTGRPDSAAGLAGIIGISRAALGRRTIGDAVPPRPNCRSSRAISLPGVSGQKEATRGNPMNAPGYFAHPTTLDSVTTGHCASPLHTLVLDTREGYTLPVDCLREAS